MDNKLDRKKKEKVQKNLSEIFNNFTLEGKDEKSIDETIQLPTKFQVLSPKLLTSHHEAIEIINDLIKNYYIYKKQTLKNNYSYEPFEISNSEETNLVHPIILFANIGHPSSLNPLRKY